MRIEESEVRFPGHGGDAVPAFFARPEGTGPWPGVVVAHEVYGLTDWARSACRRLAGGHYVSGGWSVGAVALAASWLARTLPADTRIAAIFPDGPHRYADTVYNDDYCRHHDLLGPQPAADPDEIRDPREREVLRWTRCAHVIHPTAGDAP